MRPCSARGGAGTRRAPWRCSGSAVGEKCPRRCSAWRRKTWLLLSSRISSRARKTSSVTGRFPITRWSIRRSPTACLRPWIFQASNACSKAWTQAVITRRGLDVKTAEEFGKLDQSAIDLVREQAWPDPETGDELHDALLIMGAVPSVEAGTHASWKDKYEELARAGRVTTVDERLWAATERLPMVQAAFPGARHEPAVVPPEREAAKVWSREDANREIVRGRLEVVGPTTAGEVAEALGLPVGDVDFALAALEHEGFALRWRFSCGVEGIEWCERRLLARIHRYTLDRLRKEIEPVTAADFLRFLFKWQRVATGSRADGPEGLAAVLDLLDG